MKKFYIIFSLIYLLYLNPLNASENNQKISSQSSAVIILDEGFEDNTMPPSGWSVDPTSSFTWTSKLGNSFDLPYEGSYFASVSNDPFNYPQDEWLISPYFDLSQAENAKLIFAFKTNYSKHVTENKVDVWVKISTDGGSTWSNLWREENFGVFNNTHWHVDTVDLSSYLNKYDLKIAFNYIGVQGAFFNLDKIIIEKVDIVPVELTSFTASVNKKNVNLRWITATEKNNKGFEIQKLQNSGITKLHDWEVIGFIPGNGTTTEIKSYNFIDKNVNSGSYTYRLKQIDYDGSFEYSKEVKADVNIIPAKFTLEQNYPNPFNPSTKINFTLAADSKVTLKIFNILGEEMLILLDADYPAGVHSVDFNAAGLNSGIYFYRIYAQGIDGSEFTSVKKMIFNK